MTLRSLIRRHAGQLLRTEIEIEVRVGGAYDRATGRVGEQQVVTFRVLASDAGALQKSYRSGGAQRPARDTTPEATSFFYVPVPAAGLPFEPDLAQTVVAYEKRWRVVRVRPRRVGGELVGYQLDVAGGAG